MERIILRRCRPLPYRITFYIDTVTSGQVKLITETKRWSLTITATNFKESVATLHHLLHKVTFEYPVIRFKVLATHVSGTSFHTTNYVFQYFYEDPDTKESVEIPVALLNIINNVCKTLNAFLGVNVYHLNLGDLVY